MADFEEKHSTLDPHSSLHASSDEESSVSHCQPPLPACSDGDSKTHPHVPLDAGLKAYLTTLGAFTALFFTFGQMNAFGTFQAWYSAHQLAGMPSSTISWIGSLQLWIFFVSGYPIGRLFDIYGPTYLMSAGTLCYFASIMLTSVCGQFYQYILTQGILFGLGVGLLFYPSMASISTHFSRHRATALGVAAAGSSLGGVCYPIMLHRLFHRVGFGWGVRIDAFISVAGCVIATILTTSVSQPQKPGPCLTLKTVSDLRFALLIAGSCLVALGLFVPYFYIVEYSRNIFHVSEYLPFYLLAFMNAGGVVGRVVPAIVSDRIGTFNLLIPSALLSGLFCITLWIGARSPIRIIMFCVLYGFSSGSFISLITPCIAQISDLREIGKRMGLLYTIISIPSLVGCPAAGAFLGRSHGSYTMLIVFSGCTTICGSIFIVASRLAIDRNLSARV